MKTKEVYHDPLLHNNGYGYAMNKEVVRFEMDNAKKPEQLPTFFDSPLMTPNAVTDFNAQPNPPRHDGHNNSLTWTGTSISTYPTSEPSQ